MEFEDLPAPEHEGLVPREELTVDEDNPNEMPDAVFRKLVDRMKRRGWVGNAIVADLEGVIADGEHRWRAAEEIGLSEVPVKQYDLTDEQRRLWRQELDKIRGDHDPTDDREEFVRMIDSGNEAVADDLEDLLEARNESDELDDLLGRQPDLVIPDGEIDGPEEKRAHIVASLTVPVDRWDDAKEKLEDVADAYGAELEVA